MISRRYCIALLTVLAVLLVPLRVQGLYLADGYGEHRAHVGLKLFRTLISSDLGLQDKLNEQQDLVLYLTYASSDEDAQLYLQVLQDSFNLPQSLNARIEIIPLQELLALPARQIGGVFITQQLNEDELSALVEKSIAQSFVLFSPFEGDVEQGVLGGLSVQATVRPYINMHSLKKSGLQIKSFYLKVALKYE
ncbi:hypothetical protein [Bowmanella dokdonensis]|uniref:Uncharacterized protein n=1 Tax=Bowmanella dokdonensis TaxID=751969 RepID=A0A939DJL8_9ALTE|nr:hypothetical protein [Bowmanella dokdonensis]MBN7823745.1 hypothetical protein [Bowmanella dokdonensis]